MVNRELGWTSAAQRLEGMMKGTAAAETAACLRKDRRDVPELFAAPAAPVEFGDWNMFDRMRNPGGEVPLQNFATLTVLTRPAMKAEQLPGGAPRQWLKAIDQAADQRCVHRLCVCGYSGVYRP